ncbi:MAG: NPCBM/NEW2 domain-containing protein [Phycisphaerae bacterium]|nr:NPCBM/NEW2 domain-containing protein [Phycisphaerae bacterium]
MNRRLTLMLLAFSLIVSFIAAAGAADPAWYAKKSTWRETLKTSLYNKTKGIAAEKARPVARPSKGFKPFVTKALKGGMAPLKISVPITGEKDLILVAADGGDGIGCDHSTWADAKLIGAAGKVTWLDTIRPKAVSVGYGNLQIKSNEKRRPAIIGNQKFPRYIWAHAVSTLHYEIGGKYVRFEASVGVDRREHRNAGSVSFIVTNDRKSIPRGAKSSSMALTSPLWGALLRDFPESQGLMVLNDWLRQDSLGIEDEAGKFKEPAAAALKAAADTLAYVNKSGPQTKLAAELASLTRKHTAATDDQWRDIYMVTKQLRRRIILSHPALDFERILINRNPPTLYSHNGDQHLGRHSRVGKGLAILTGWKTDNLKATPMLKAGKLPDGAVRNPDLHYDAEKVAFAFCDHTRQGQKRYFLYEAAIDGSWVRQLTGTKRDKFNTWDNRATVIIEDNDPCYLPDDNLVFITTRCQSFGRCHGGRYNPAWTLHRCDKNGDNIKQLSFGNENEYEPSVLNDGRIVFTRWEYTNRHEMFFHMLWACRPDGTNVTHFFGNDMLHPMMMVEATAIPGTHRVMTTAQGHHSYNTGTTIVLDTNIGENTEKAITHLTPETPYSESPGGGWPKPHYSHPHPLTEDLFLASRANHNVHPQGRTPPPADRAIYLVDPAGGRELIYEDPDVASFSPIPIRKRKRPPVMPTMVRPDAPDYGTVFLQNAYLTRKENDPKGIIKPGMIKAIRVIAIGVQPRAGRSALHMRVHVEIPRKVIGTVPVDATGSAYFKVPARTSLQVQTLDENGMAILTEKSLFYLQPGENRSCVGCHEPEGSSPIVSAMAKLRRLRPVDLKPAAGPAYEGGLSFMRTVQPVLDRYCIKCHGLGEGKDPKSEKIKLIHDGQLTWPQSYKELFARGDHRVGDKGYMHGNKNHQPEDRNISKPRRFFAFSNKVAHMLVKNHGKCNMDRDSYMRIIEWMDVNAQCYGDLFPYKLEERRIDAKAMTALRAYVKELFGAKIAAQPDRALINTVQIDESRILMAPLATQTGGWGQIPGYASKDDPKYKKMADLVDKCIVRNRNENTRGWQPTLDAGGGEKWVMEDRAKLISGLKGATPKSK